MEGNHASTPPPRKREVVVVATWIARTWGRAFLAYLLLGAVAVALGAVTSGHPVAAVIFGVIVLVIWLPLLAVFVIPVATLVVLALRLVPIGPFVVARRALALGATAIGTVVGVYAMLAVINLWLVVSGAPGFVSWGSASSVPVMLVASLPVGLFAPVCPASSG